MLTKSKGEIQVLKDERRRCGRRRRNFDVAGGLLVSWFIVLEKKQKNGTVCYYSVDLFSTLTNNFCKKKSGVKYLAPLLTLCRRH